MQARAQSVEAKFEPKKPPTQGAANSIFAYLEWNEAEKAWIADIEPPVVTQAIQKMGIDQADAYIINTISRASIFEKPAMHAWPNSGGLKPAFFFKQYASIKSDSANPQKKKLYIENKEFGEVVIGVARAAERKMTYVYYVLRDDKILLPMAGQEVPCGNAGHRLFERRIAQTGIATLKKSADNASYHIYCKTHGEITKDNFALFQKHAWEKCGFYFTDDSKKIIPIVAKRDTLPPAPIKASPKASNSIAIASNGNSNAIASQQPGLATERRTHITKKVAPKRKTSTANTNKTPAAASNDIAIASNGNSYAIASQQLGLAIAVGSNSYAAVNSNGAVTAVSSSDTSTQHNNQAEQAKPKRQKVTHKSTTIPRATSDEAHLLLNMFSSPQTSESKHDGTQPPTVPAPSIPPNLGMQQAAPFFPYMPMLPYLPMPMGKLPWSQSFCMPMLPPLPQQLAQPMLHQPHAIPAGDVTMTDAAAVPQPAFSISALVGLFRPTNQTAIAPQTTTASSFITSSPVAQGGSAQRR